MPHPALRHSLAILAFSFALSALTPGCSSSSSSPIRAGYVNFYIEFYDYVIDRDGHVQQAYCSNVATFVGDVDFRCDFRPMVWSYGQNHWMYCTYRDAVGNPWWYTDLYYFWPGYIQEPYCIDDQIPPDAPTNMDITESSQLNRDGMGRLALGDGVEVIDQAIAVDTVTELRSLLEANPVLAGSEVLESRPAMLSSEPEAIRLGTPVEGVPPE